MATSEAGYCLTCQVEILSFPPLFLPAVQQSVDKVHLMQKQPQGGRLS